MALISMRREGIPVYKVRQVSNSTATGVMQIVTNLKSRYPYKSKGYVCSQVLIIPFSDSKLFVDGISLVSEDSIGDIGGIIPVNKNCVEYFMLVLHEIRLRRDSYIKYLIDFDDIVKSTFDAALVASP